MCSGSGRKVPAVQEIEDPDARCPDCGEVAYNHELGVLCTDLAAAARCYEAYAVAAEGLSERGEPLWPWEVLWRRSPRSAQAWVRGARAARG